ncbi:MAG: methyltransferase domain-containing protein [Methylobacteriaceae bacterium]|nr:methyltransferase domain-containing protein [Methylobacteriaceae bacterium]
MTRALLISHSGERCGVYQYGRNLFNVLEASHEIAWSYRECGAFAELQAAVEEIKPAIVLFNYQGSTLPWLRPAEIRSLGIATAAVFHESNQQLVDLEKGDLFDLWLCPDPTIIPRNPRVSSVPRFLPPSRRSNFHSDVFTAGTFGFPTPSKGFPRLCQIVNNEFDRAVIRINMPYHDKPEIFPSPTMMDDIIQLCRAAVTKPGIDLRITHDFLDDDGLIDFLSSNTINAFLYSDPSAKGLSSCVDFALAAGRPIALTKSPMFRHVAGANPSVFIEDSSLKEIAERGTSHLEPFRTQWSSAHASIAWNDAVLTALQSAKTSASVPDRRGFNKILDDRSRAAYSATLADLHRLAPEMMSRKIERANIQQAFALDTARRILKDIINPRILAVGSFEDTAVEALRREGYQITEVDPNVSGMTLLDFYRANSPRLGSFDLILSVSVLEHVENDVQFVRMIGEFLKPGAHAVLTVDFAESWKEGGQKPTVDHRLYTTQRIVEVLMPAIGNCVLVDVPTWAEGREDFEYEGSTYGFGSFVFRKLDAEMVAQAAVAPVWNELLADGRSDPSKREGGDKMTTIKRLFQRR